MTGQFTNNPKIKIVSDDPSNLRVRSLYYLIFNSKTYSPFTRPSKQIALQSDYNIISVFKNYKDLVNLALPENRVRSKIFFDVSEDLFEHKDFGPVFSLLCICSDFVTCSNAFLQEKIYDYTGRLAAIISNPRMDIPQEIKKETINTKEFLWYGTITDIFSIKKEASENNSIFVGTDAFGTNLVNTLYYLSKKDKGRILKKFDVVYLPKTFTKEAEIRRAEKARESLSLGKVVIAPLLDETLFFDMTLKEFSLLSNEEVIKRNKQYQLNLTELEGKDSCIGQLEKAIEISKTDNFFEEFDQKVQKSKKDNT